MSSFIESVIKHTSLMPLSVQSLHPTKMGELLKLCQALSEITAIFCAVNQINHTYRDKDGYVLKRLY